MFRLSSAIALFSAGLALSVQPLAAQQSAPPATVPVPSLTVEQQALLKCSVAMAMMAERQRAGHDTEGEWPALGTRGREFFVRAMARLMDETGADQRAISQLARDQVVPLNAPGALAQAMPPCLIMLELSGL